MHPGCRLLAMTLQSAVCSYCVIIELSPAAYYPHKPAGNWPVTACLLLHGSLSRTHYTEECDYKWAIFTQFLHFMVGESGRIEITPVTDWHCGDNKCNRWRSADELVLLCRQCELRHNSRAIRIYLFHILYGRADREKQIQVYLISLRKSASDDII